MEENIGDSPSSSEHYQRKSFIDGEADAYFSRNPLRYKVPFSTRLLGEWCKPYKENVQ